MSETTDPGTAACLGEPCRSYRPGHNVHFIQLKQAGLAAWNWRDAVVVALEGLDVRLRYLANDHEFSVRHHKALDSWLQPGDPVSVHERFHLLLAGDTAFSVAVTGGLGEAPQPELPVQGPVLVAELATGHGRGRFLRE